MKTNQPVTAPFESLEEGLSMLVRCLEMHIPLRVWMVTRVTGNDWNVLHVRDRENKVKRGDVYVWSDSYCTRMVNEGAPCFAPDAHAVPAYRNANINNVLKIGSYIGQPLRSSDGGLLGTLCAIDPEPRDSFSKEQQFLVETVTRTMSTLISAHLIIEQARQKEAKLRYQAETDRLTGLANRHAWEEALYTEETALDALGENAIVMFIDLDGLKQVNDTFGHEAGDQYLRKAAAVLQDHFRHADLLARIGGDEFALLIRGLSKEEAGGLKERLAQAFEKAKVRASIGYAMRLSHRSLKETLRAAEVRMYEEKIRRKRALLDR
ncbi:sensor domain-containing diguanylate cyclase [Noviherbaspirillum pedocola]|uniref:diguanylate cyclase n=1 Tax=Noviherbaspirillum pedocola TaxID=2801341 RepID=A0A934T043_9BURK|nr:sensor domain-containing diguanylate cyclase [Noviherbaspirillum pedocola]MBK4738515.1 sensor domain-containing diguanylate cyclase [Noviherbaspirillum pedocola]